MGGPEAGLAHLHVPEFYWPKPKFKGREWSYKGTLQSGYWKGERVATLTLCSHFHNTMGLIQNHLPSRSL